MDQPVQPKNCPACGKPSEPNWKSCPYCGCNFEKGASVPVKVKPSATTSGQKPPVSQKKGMPTWGWLLIILGGAGCVILTIVILGITGVLVVETQSSSGVIVPTAAVVMPGITTQGDLPPGDNPSNPGGSIPSVGFMTEVPAADKKDIEVVDTWYAQDPTSPTYLLYGCVIQNPNPEIAAGWVFSAPKECFACFCTPFGKESGTAFFRAGDAKMNVKDSLAFRIAGATEELSETSLLVSHGFPAFFTEGVGDNHLRLRTVASITRRNFNRVFTLRITGAGHKLSESSRFEYHGFPAFFTVEIRRGLFIRGPLTIAFFGEIHGVFTGRIIGTGDKTAIFPPFDGHGAPAFLADRCRWESPCL